MRKFGKQHTFRLGGDTWPRQMYMYVSSERIRQHVCFVSFPHLECKFSIISWPFFYD